MSDSTLPGDDAEVKPDPLDDPPILDDDIRKAIEEDGWVFGDADDFLELTEEEWRSVSEMMMMTPEAMAEIERHRRELEEDESWDPEEIG